MGIAAYGTVQSVFIGAASSGTLTWPAGSIPGDMVLVGVGNNAVPNVNPTSFSGGGIIWDSSALIVYSVTDATNWRLTIWRGIVLNSLGGTITCNLSGTDGGAFTINAQEFTAGFGPATLWSLDKSGGITNASSGTCLGPSLTPTNNGEIFFSMIIPNQTGSSVDGTFTYKSCQAGFLAWDLNTGTSALQPSVTQSPADVSWGVGVTLTAANSQTQVHDFTTAGAQTFVPPPGVHSIKCECWGPGGGGGTRTTTGGGGGGGGGEYAAEPALAVTPGTTYSFTVQAAGTPGTTGSNQTFAGDSVTVTAHAGASVASNTTTGGAGGSGSANTTHHNGGSGGPSTTSPLGGGGGSSGGSAAAGNTGTAGGSGGTGGAAVTDGGVGGNGATVGNTNGSAPASGNGGGGGGGDRSSSGTRTGGNGAAGRVRITVTFPPYVVAQGSFVPQMRASFF